MDIVGDVTQVSYTISLRASLKAGTALGFTLCLTACPLCNITHCALSAVH